MLARVVLTVSSVAIVLGNNEEFRSIYETANLIQADGYVSEAHGVLTTDGYMLEMHRIPFKKDEKSGAPDRPVVFLMHGLLGASNSFLFLGPEYSIAYNLADAGFDVWMGNARGTKNSRQHINLNPDNHEDRSKFFDFSWEEIGYYDVANMVDYVLEKTNNTKLHYVGYSQGGTVFLVLNSLRPEYNEKFISAHLLAAVGYMEYFPNKHLKSLAMFTNTIYSLATRLEIVELFPPMTDEMLRQGADDYEINIGENFDTECDKNEGCRPVDYCTGTVKQKEMCELFGLEEIMSARILDNIMSDYETGGASLKQLAHYGQNVEDKAFRRWNYGTMTNLIKYGTHQPPIYDLSRITVNTTMHYSGADNLLDKRDVFAMCQMMPNCVERKVPRETFGHVDFVVAGDVKDLVTEHMIHKMMGMQKIYSGLRMMKFQNNTVSDGSSNITPDIMTAFLISTIWFIFNNIL